MPSLLVHCRFQSWVAEEWWLLSEVPALQAAVRAKIPFAILTSTLLLLAALLSELDSWPAPTFLQLFTSEGSTTPTAAQKEG